MNFSGNLVVLCSDERFVKEILHYFDKIYGRYDVVAVPGSAAFIPRGEGCLIDRLRFLIESHSIKRIALVAHEDCGFYKAVYSGLSSNKLRDVELEDLRKAKKYIVENMGVEEVKLYFIDLNKNIFEVV